MGPTVLDLVEMPHLRLKLRAGGKGVNRQVTWAQASDLDTPWEWMTGGELLMKNGRTLPPDADGQLALLRGLADHGTAGLILGMDPDTPELHSVATDAADELGLPIVIAPFSAGFAAIGRAVAEANLSDEGRRLAMTERVYTLIQRSVLRSGRGGILDQLSRELRCRLVLLDADTGLPVLDGSSAPPEGLRRGVVSLIAERGGVLPGVLHLDAEGVRGQIVEVPDEDPTVLVTYDFRSAPPDLVLLQHVATAAAVLLVQQDIRREHRRRLGAESLANLLDLRLGEHELSRQLHEAGLPPERAVLVAIHGGSTAGERHLHLSLDRHRIPNLLLRRAGLLYALVPSTPQTIAVLQRRLGPEALFGISDPLVSASRAPAAVREANWAVRDAQNAADHVSRYADATLLSVLRDADEAQLVVDRVLGELLAYDAAHGTDLTDTLDTFLRLDKSWKSTADAVGVHRQTVAYRLRRIEEITGRNLATTAHTAELWLALRARDLVTAPGG
ncbi:PucR family transcriptional regulator [Mycolicibacterium sp. CH28]|uniref:PucR family transcriptional regulator n=1 Tax=Mycolicibacterium sp. CH28 TaxID=2512237 RepID=UPI001080CF48|nr:PucR family transcriptional regulator [Mycolicibacterium sp. CH28]TGD84547.1 PucR family transcriptional regulator [Mycolicibacterium sp. CH28]